MKKTLAFIVTLFVSFLVFISTAKAVGGKSLLVEMKHFAP